MAAEYVELHAHSNFSFLAGASHPEELVSAAATMGYKAIALTDSDGLYGVVRQSQAALEHNIKAIAGSELTFEDQSHLTLLAKNQEGYSNLSALITRGRRAAEKGSSLVPKASLNERSAGLIALSGDAQGAIPQAILRGDFSEAQALASHFRSLFEPGCFFLEMMNHHLPFQSALNDGLLQISRSLELPIVATNDVHYHHSDRRALQDLLTCVRHHKHLDEAGTCLLPNGNFALLSPEQALARWAAYPSAIRNTLRIAEMCNFDLKDLDVSLPDFPVPEPYQDAQSYLEHLTFLDAQGRFDALGTKEITQLRHELRVIEELGLAGYFLIVWDIMRFCGKQGILAQGRGSAANSAVCFALGITNVNPIKLDLLFERFLSEGRKEPPDIDIDIANNRREQVIQYVYETYGRDHASMVCEVICYRARSAVRDIAKAFGLSSAEVDVLAKRLDGRRFSKGVVVEGLGQVTTTKEEGGEDASAQDASAQDASAQDASKQPAALQIDSQQQTSSNQEAKPQATEVEASDKDTLLEDLDLDPRIVSRILKYAQQLEGFPRHLGIHVGGMILCSAPLSERVPIENATMADRTVIQWDKDDVNALKVPKIDLLGLGMLSLLADCLQLISIHEGVHFDPSSLPHDDEATYDMICAADTVGVFQIESRAQMNTLPRMRPRCFYDLVVEVALIRPGPLQGDMVHPYLRRRAGEEEITYPHPDLQPVLKRTLGIPLFQEQGMKVAITAAGFTPDEADELRRAMKSRRMSERMRQLRTKLYEGMLARNYDPEMAERVVKQIEAFSSYGFPESHAASFAFLVYLSAYLKCHYPWAFYCALLNNQPMGFYSPSTIVSDARRHGVSTMPLDIVHSQWDWVLDGRKLRPGLKSVRGFGESHWELLLAARNRRPFTSVSDVCKRSNLPKRILETLAQAGAFGTLQKDRRSALWAVQGHRVRPGLAAPEREEKHTQLAQLSRTETLVQDLNTTGYAAHDHPIHHLRAVLKKWDVISSYRLNRTARGKRVRVAGVASVRQKPPTAKGFCFLTLEDPDGMLNIIIDPTTYTNNRAIVRRSVLMLIEGRVERSRGVVNVRAEKIASLDDRFKARMRSRNFH